MPSNLELLPEKVPCRICGKELDPNKPLGGKASNEEISRPGGEFYCMECWFRETGTLTVESLLAREQDRVLLE
jgi:hypothetical protein